MVGERFESGGVLAAVMVCRLIVWVIGSRSLRIRNRHTDHLWKQMMVLELVAVDLCSGSGPDAEAFRAASGFGCEAEAFPLRVILSNGFAVEVVGDFDGAVFEKLLMILGRL